MKFIIAAALVALAVAVPACGKKNILTAPPSVVTQQGKVAYTADQVVVRINELENTAIAANNDGSLKDDVAISIVKFCVSADKTAKTTPDGLKPALKTGWAELQKNLVGKTVPPTLTLAIGALDGIITTFTAGVTQ